MSESNVTDEQLPKNAGRGGEVEPVPAASVVVIRRGTFELLLLRRSEQSTFVPGSWIFPGGALEQHDRDLASAIGASDESSLMKICGVRETLEESGVWLGEPGDARELREMLAGGAAPAADFATVFKPALARLTLTSRWITPAGMPKRYDTFFFIAPVDDTTDASVDAVEVTDALWIRPDEALQRHRDRELPLLFPTIRNLEVLCGFSSVDELIASRRGIDVPIMRPVLIVENGKKKIILPDEQ